MLIFAFLIACHPSAEMPLADTGPGGDGDVAVECPDEARVRAAIRGEIPVGDIHHAIAWSGGWPVRTCAGTWLFVADAKGRTLAGDHSGWVDEPMTDGPGFSWSEIAIGAPEGSGYKFGPTLEADPWARNYDFDEYGEISFVLPPEDRPHLERWPAVEGEGLLPRDLRVYVPDGEGPFDVLYAQDGQNLFDPEAIWGGWRLQEPLTNHPSVLVVGIDNTAARMDDYTHTYDAVVGTGGNADAYSRLVHSVIRPHVEDRYPTSGHNGLLGSSLGGLVSLVVADAAPEEWDFVGSMSGTLGFGKLASDNELIVERWEHPPRGPVLYVDSGGDAGGGQCSDPNGDGYLVDDPDDSDNFCANREFADRLAAAGYTWEEDLFHWHQAGAPHNEAAWASRVERPLAIFASLR